MKYLSLPLVLAGGVLGAPLFAQENVGTQRSNPITETLGGAPKLEEVIVIASRVETPLREVGASVSLIDRAEIELRGYPTVAELLRTQPGVSVTNTGGAGKQTALRIRGEDGYRTLILIDGVEVSDPTGTQVMPQVEHLTTGSEIERIEVLRGPQGFIYGADAGGVVQIYSRRASQGVTGQIGLEGGRYGTQKFNTFVAAANSAVDAFVSASSWSTDGFNTAVADVDGDLDGYSNTTLHGKFGWQILPNWRAQLVVRDLQAENQYDSCFGSHDCENREEQTTTKLSLDHNDNTRFSNHISVAETQVAREYLSNGVASYETEGSRKEVNYLGEFAATEVLKVVFGGDAEKSVVEVVGVDDLKQTQVGIFSELHAGFAERVFLTAGFRYDDNDDFGEHLSGRVTSAYWISAGETGKVKLRASAGNGFRAPSLQEIAYNQNYGFGVPATTALKEETSSGYDLGIEYHRESGASLELTWFEQSIEDEIVFDLLSYSGYFQDDGRSHSKGVEAQLVAPLLSWLRAEASFTRNLTETAKDTPRIRRPGKVLNVSLFIDPMEDLVILVNNRWARDAVEGANLVPLDDYRVLDISVSYKLLPAWEIFGRMENALDEDYQELPGYNTAGRSGHLGTRFTF